MQARSPVVAEQLITALVARYVRDEDPASPAATDDVARVIAALPIEPILEGALMLGQVESALEAPLAGRERAILASIDDCLKMINSLTEFEPDVDVQLRTLRPRIAAELLATPDAVLNGNVPVLSVADLIAAGLAGWYAALGRSAEKLLDKTAGAVDEIRENARHIEEIEAELRQYLSKDHERVTKLEERLAASETGRVRSQQSRVLAAGMINEVVRGNQVTANLDAFLKGPWYDSAQYVVLTQGVDAEDWARMRALTETLIWTCQPIEEEDKQRLYRIIEHLPGEIRELLIALQHNNDAVESALEAIEADHLTVVTGQELAYVEYAPIEAESTEAARPKVSRVLLRKVDAFEPGHWFVSRLEDEPTRIKLLLKLDDVRQLVFTNRHGMRVLQCSFESFAYWLSTGVVKPLRADAIFTATFRTFYNGLIEEHARQQQRLAERKQLREREQQEREDKQRQEREAAAERVREEQEAVRAAAERARDERLAAAATALEDADPAVVEAITSRVSELAIGAWLRLPGPDGRLEECKLAVRISGSDKMIFVSQTGGKIGEYTSDELTRLLVAGQGEVKDEGVEFEDTLQQVVSKLRQDRHKSYDDLTGE